VGELMKGFGFFLFDREAQVDAGSK